MRLARHIPRSLLGLSAITTLTACEPAETPAPVTVVDGRGAPVVAPDRHRPIASPIPDDLFTVPALPEHALPKGFEEPVEEPLDDSDHIITLDEPVDGAPYAAEGLLGESQHGLQGAVNSTRYTFTNRRVNAGSNATYQLNTTIADAVLITSAGDADLYLENCDGSIVTSSARAGTATDHAGYFAGNGVANCKRIRVRGFLNSTYSLYLYTYR